MPAAYVLPVQDHFCMEEPEDFHLQALLKNLGGLDATVKKAGKSLHLKKMALWNPSSI